MEIDIVDLYNVAAVMASCGYPKATASWQRISEQVRSAALESGAQPTRADNTGSPKFCFNCKPESVLWRKMVDNFYDYCPYCGAKLRAGA